jgi:hypothetical protein
MDLTDEQWAIIEPHIPKPRECTDGNSRPRSGLPATIHLESVIEIYQHEIRLVKSFPKIF